MLSIQTEREVKEVVHEFNTAVEIDLGVVIAPNNKGEVFQQLEETKKANSTSLYENCICDGCFIKL